MIKLTPLIIISSTISPVCPTTFHFDNDYSYEAQVYMEKNKVKDCQDTSNILYDLILEELLKNND